MNEAAVLAATGERVLGLDLAIQRTGAAWRTARGRMETKAIEAPKLSTNATPRGQMERLLWLTQQVSSLVRLHGARRVVIEDHAYSQPRLAALAGTQRAVELVLYRDFGIVTERMSPQTARLLAAGLSGRPGKGTQPTKEQVHRAVRQLVDLPGTTSPDELDAVVLVLAAEFEPPAGRGERTPLEKRQCAAWRKWLRSIGRD
jgi:Holliday junction resolvasome RuvABC endonuclease subunit